MQAEDLALIIAWLRDEGLPWDEAYGWAEMYAGHPDQEPVDSIDGLIPAPNGREMSLQEWSRRVGALGPLAYAAGLTVEEAEARRRGHARRGRTADPGRVARLPDRPPRLRSAEASGLDPRATAIPPASSPGAGRSAATESSAPRDGGPRPGRVEDTPAPHRH